MSKETATEKDMKFRILVVSFYLTLIFIAIMFGPELGIPKESRKGVIKGLTLLMFVVLMVYQHGFHYPPRVRSSAAGILICTMSALQKGTSSFLPNLTYIPYVLSALQVGALAYMLYLFFKYLKQDMNKKEIRRYWILRAMYIILIIAVPILIRIY